MKPPPPADRDTQPDTLEATLNEMRNALKRIEGSLAVALGQWQSTTREVGELGARVSKLEARAMNGSEHPGSV